jgi:hypothetical protein
MKVLKRGKEQWEEGPGKEEAGGRRKLDEAVCISGPGNTAEFFF